MSRKSTQHPREPVGADSFIYDPELSNPEPPEHITAIPEGNLVPYDHPVLKLERVFSKTVYIAIVFCAVTLSLLMFGQVLLRYVFKSPFVGIEELGLLFGAWSYFLGIVYVTRNGEHIHGGILSLIVKNKNKIRFVRLFMTVLSIGACAIFGYFAIRYALFEIQTGRLSSYMRWPKGLWSASLIVGFCGTIIYLIMQAVNQIIDYKFHMQQKGGN